MDIIDYSRVTRHTYITYVFDSETTCQVKSAYTMDSYFGNQYHGAGTFWYKYKVNDDMSASFEAPFDSLVAGYSLRLVFTAPDRGRLDYSTPSQHGTFVLKPYERSLTSPLVNISTRVVVRPGDAVVVGFVLSGDKPHDVLLRVVGPGLSGFGVSPVWSKPWFRLYKSIQEGSLGLTTCGAFWTGWSSRLGIQEKAWERAGAFPLTLGSLDRSEVCRLESGAYSIVLTPGAYEDGGTALVEVYTLY